MKILLVEDNATDADLIQRGLTNSLPYCSVVHASTLHMARELLLQAETYCIALVDMNLPDGYGLDLLLEIREKGLEIPTIVLTGSGNEELAATALKMGADDYMVKDNNYSGLAKNIEIAIHNFKQSQSQKARTINVLYVEHHSTDIDLTIRHFKSYAPHIVIDAAVSAEEAILKLKKLENKQVDYDVVLMDYSLPALSSFDLIKMIKNDFRMEQPIILVSGQGNEDVAVQALKLGVADYLTKNRQYLYRLPSAITSALRQAELETKQAELERSEKQYRMLVENQGEGIGIVDVNQVFLFANPAAEEIFGVPSGKLVGRNLSDYIVREQAADFDSEILKRSKGEASSYEIEIINAQNERRSLIVTASPHYDEKEHFIGSFGIFRDITERKVAERALQESHEFNSTILQTIPFGMNIIDEHGNILFISEKLKSVFGDDALGKKCWEVYREDKDQCSRCPLRKGIEIDTMGMIETSGIMGGKHFQINQAGMMFQGKKAMLEIFQDITEKKQAELDLKIAKEKAEESDRLKTAFLTNMSHEIRTPMNGILGFANLLGAPNLSEENRILYSDIVKKSGERLFNTVNDIIEISQFDAGLTELTLSSVNLNVFLKDQVQFHSLEASNKGLVIDFEVPEADWTIETDRSKLESVVTNLLNNAIKFTDRGRIELGMLVSEQIEIYVKDTGKGISEDKVERIFDRFYQTNTKYNSGYEGNGLGLSIVKAYVEMLGGEISVDSVYKQGTCFTFTLPIKEREGERAIKAKNERNKAITGMHLGLKILIVEDDENSSMYLKELLNDYASEILCAGNGQEAVEIYSSNKDIDLVLMDIKMPVMDGYEASRQIVEFHKEALIIAQSAHVFMSDQSKALESGCKYYLPKPIERDKLMQIIQNQFSSPE